eukprot:m.16304 g.16304  ORF g.16304 m.16304 type:complete len:230 (-) comp10390_c0_seq1:44-733(-)
MSSVVVKRGYEEVEATERPPHCSPLLLKRCPRINPPAPPVPTLGENRELEEEPHQRHDRTGQNLSMLRHRVPLRVRANETRDNSPFVPKRPATAPIKFMQLEKRRRIRTEPDEDDEQQQQQHHHSPQPRQRRRSGTLDSSSLSALSRPMIALNPPGVGPPKDPTKDMLFTYEQVKNIVESAVRERELHLREEYDNTLEERISDLFRTFTKYNEDHIHRQMEQSPYVYTT